VFYITLTPAVGYNCELLVSKFVRAFEVVPPEGCLADFLTFEEVVEIEHLHYAAFQNTDNDVGYLVSYRLCVSLHCTRVTGFLVVVDLVQLHKGQVCQLMRQASSSLEL
jgi:hypothetical protein